MKIKNGSRKQTVISATESESDESKRFHFLPTPVMIRFRRLRSRENQIVGVGSRSGRINQSQCTFPCFVIGFSSSAPTCDSVNLVFP